jgi:hypothetical protein
VNNNQLCSKQKFWERKHDASQTQHGKQLHELQTQLQEQEQLASATQEEAVRVAEANTVELRALLKDV